MKVAMKVATLTLFGLALWLGCTTAPRPTQGWNPLRKFLQWEEHKQGELEVLPKRVLTCFQPKCDRSHYLP